MELPEDIASETINGYAPIVQMPIRRPVVEGVAIDLLVSELENSQRPVVLVGAGANRKRVSRYLTEFVTKYDIPNAYGMIKIKQAQAGFDEYSLDFPNPVFIQLAVSFGAKGIKVEKADEFYPALKKALHTRGVVLMDVAFTYPGSVVD